MTSKIFTTLEAIHSLVNPSLELKDKGRQPLTDMQNEDATHLLHPAADDP
jgi:hypothetical protein